MRAQQPAYVFSENSAAKDDENYRIFSLMENAEEEKERQTAALLTWEMATASSSARSAICSAPPAAWKRYTAFWPYTIKNHRPPSIFSSKISRAAAIWIIAPTKREMWPLMWRFPIRSALAAPTARWCLRSLKAESEAVKSNRPSETFSDGLFADKLCRLKKRES